MCLLQSGPKNPFVSRLQLLLHFFRGERTPVSHLFSVIYRGYTSLPIFITIGSGPMAHAQKAGADAEEALCECEKRCVRSVLVCVAGWGQEVPIMQQVVFVTGIFLLGKNR